MQECDVRLNELKKQKTELEEEIEALEEEMVQLQADSFIDDEEDYLYVADTNNPKYPGWNVIPFKHTIRFKVECKARGRSKYRDELEIDTDTARVELIESDFNAEGAISALKDRLKEEGKCKFDWIAKLQPMLLETAAKRVENDSTEFIEEYIDEHAREIAEDCCFDDGDLWIYGDWDDDPIAVEHVSKDILILVPVSKEALRTAGVDIER